MFKEDTPTRPYGISLDERSKTKPIVYDEAPMPSGHKQNPRHQEDMFISAFYDNQEFIKEDKSEGFSSDVSNEIDFDTGAKIEPSPGYNDY
jgi:hypothetical protein